MISPTEHVEAWKERVAIALDQLSESRPRALSAAAKVLSEFLDRFSGRPDVVDAVLRNQREWVIDRLLEIADINEYVLSASLGTLARLGCTQGLSLAEEALQSANPYVREAGIRLFGIAAPDSDIVKLEPFLDDPHRPASLAAIRAVGRRGWSHALPELLRILANRREQVRKLFDQQAPRRGDIEPLLQAIVLFMGKQAVPLLLEIAEHDVSLRSYATRRLVNLDVPEAAPVLAHLLSDSSRTLRLEVLSLVQKANYRQALPLVRPLLECSESTLRAKALAIIGEWGDVDAVGLVERMARCESNPRLRVEAISVMVDLAGPQNEGTLLELCLDSNTRVRQTVAECLGRLPSCTELAITALRYLAEADADAGVRDAACRTLAKQTNGALHLFIEPPEAIEEIPVPFEILPDLPRLVELLKAWRKYLPTLATTRSVENIHTLDSSLGHVVGAAEEALAAAGHNLE